MYLVAHTKHLTHMWSRAHGRAVNTSDNQTTFKDRHFLKEHISRLPAFFCVEISTQNKTPSIHMVKKPRSKPCSFFSKFMWIEVAINPQLVKIHLNPPQYLSIHMI
jgi:hypothetical protein